MVTGLFRELFNKKFKGVEVTPYSGGETFPFENFTGKSQLIIFLSLTCSACIDFIPEIEKLTGQDPYDVTICVAGTHVEIEELKEHLTFNCSVISVTEKEKIEKYLVPSTPYMYLLDKKMLVITSGIVESADEVTTLLRKSKNI